MSEPVFDHLQAAFGVRLFTVTAHDRDGMVFRRCHTSHPADYPLAGTKPLTLEDPWSRQVITLGQTFVANSPDRFRDLFADHAQIAALGCGSVANIPVSDDRGRVMGTVNALDVAGHFTPEMLGGLEALVRRNCPALLRAFADATF